MNHYVPFVNYLTWKNDSLRNGHRDHGPDFFKFILLITQIGSFWIRRGQWVVNSNRITETNQKNDSLRNGSSLRSQTRFLHFLKYQGKEDQPSPIQWDVNARLYCWKKSQKFWCILYKYHNNINTKHQVLAININKCLGHIAIGFSGFNKPPIEDDQLPAETITVSIKTSTIPIITSKTITHSVMDSIVLSTTANKEFHQPLTSQTWPHALHNTT